MRPMEGGGGSVAAAAMAGLFLAHMRELRASATSRQSTAPSAISQPVDAREPRGELGRWLAVLKQVRAAAPKARARLVDPRAVSGGARRGGWRARIETARLVVQFCFGRARSFPAFYVPIVAYDLPAANKEQNNGVCKYVPFCSRRRPAHMVAST